MPGKSTSSKVGTSTCVWKPEEDDWWYGRSLRSSKCLQSSLKIFDGSKVSLGAAFHMV
jgi:hypothetical protein